ncbi:alpha/beta-hydrolase [Armillaria luteobubalina]|uniref:Carboxylic ester hydrolase n=1 Tax=Armillaria luteobubalina TaxID=153913 RepID=A0AA39UMS6_9AGAR|nr:alpha/beta-hydrolase [Armillaria luteobubalina]
MKLLFVLLAVHLAPSVYAVNSSSTSSLGPIINLGYASYAGNTTSSAGLEDGPVVFYGNIPYAQLPVDDLRWRAPRMLNEEAQTSEVVDARGWGPPCLQHPAMVGIGSEADCLKVNVWKPKNVYEGDALPVAVYIHGGGFNANSPQGFPLYNWVEQRGKLVGVSITYRLGLLGFLGGSLLATDGDLNVGLLDQRAALEWIQRHISKFGGDPNDITIYGESAGGASMVMQVTAYGGTRPVPFKRVVAQSIGFGPTLTEAEVETAFLHASKIIGCSSSDNVMSCLRRASLGALVSAINSMPTNPSYQFSPVIEGPAGFLPGLPSRLIQSGNFSTVEFIGGHCTNDGRTFAGGAPEDFVTDSDIKRLVFSRWPAVSNATMAKALTLYPSPQIPGSPFATQYDRAWTMAGEIIFTCMDWYLAESLASRGVENVFSYSWDAPDTVLYNARPYLGAMHTSDLYYLFSGKDASFSTFGNAGNTFTPFNTVPKPTLSREAINYWTAFASTGDPSSDQDAHVPLWEKYVRSDTLRRMDLSRGNDTVTGSRMVTVPANEIARCKFWMSEDVTAETRV